MCAGAYVIVNQDYLGWEIEGTCRMCWGAGVIEVQRGR